MISFTVRQHLLLKKYNLSLENFLAVKKGGREEVDTLRRETMLLIWSVLKDKRERKGMKE